MCGLRGREITQINRSAAIDVRTLAATLHAGAGFAKASGEKLVVHQVHDSILVTVPRAGVRTRIRRSAETRHCAGVRLPYGAGQLEISAGASHDSAGVDRVPGEIKAFADGGRSGQADDQD